MKEKREKGVKNGDAGLVFLPWAKQSRTMGPSLHKFFFICQPSFLCLCLSLFVGPGGSELNLFGGEGGGWCGASECCEAAGLSNW